MRWALAVAAALLAASLAGCGGKTDTTTSGTDTGTLPGTSTGSRSGTGTVTTTSTPTGSASASLDADTQSGQAPLNVTFTLAATGGEVFSWRLSYGDGTSPESGTTQVPATKTHSYQVGGTFSATFNVTFKDKRTAGDSVQVTVTVPETGPPPPAHFDTEAAAGCAGDFLQDAGANCASFTAGPTQPVVDGHWIALDSRYWGKSFTTAMEPAAYTDTDCFFVAADAKTILGDASNSSGLCTGAPPPLTAWLFLYSYGAPHQSMTVDFTF